MVLHHPNGEQELGRQIVVAVTNDRNDVIEVSLRFLPTGKRTLLLFWFIDSRGNGGDCVTKESAPRFLICFAVLPAEDGDNIASKSSILALYRLVIFSEP